MMKDILRLEANGPGRVWLGLLLGLWIVSAGFSGCAPEDAEATVRFDIEEGPAVETLKEAARQAEVEFIFSSDLVEDIRTPAVKGKYTPFHAFELMLDDSPFIVVQHQQSGVYSIQRSKKEWNPSY